MNHLVFFLEERSAREMLKNLLPRILPDLPDNVRVCYVVFEGKQDLENQLARKLRGWRVPDTRFVVMRDKDQADCLTVKCRLVRICRDAGKPDVLVRILCHELESWYLGDLNAVEQGLQIAGLAQKQGRSKYRTPDRITNPVLELRRLTKDMYQKIGGSRAVGLHLSPDGNRSHSFTVFVSGLRRLVQSNAGG